MKIVLDDKHSIKSDYGISVKLVETRQGMEKGEPIDRDKPIGYFPTVSDALKYYVKFIVHNSDEEFSIASYVDKVNEIYEDISERARTNADY